jgi:filamentous hemagglutinin
MGWEEGSKEKVSLHSIVGAGIAALTGSNALEGAASAAATQIALGKMLDVLRDNDIDPTSEEGKALLQLASLAIGGAVGGGEGATIALSATQNNYLTHQERMEYLEAAKACNEGSSDACAVAADLEQRSNLRNEALYAACISANSANCTTELNKAKAALETQNEGGVQYAEWLRDNLTSLKDLKDSEGNQRALVTHTTSTDLIWKIDCALLGGCDTFSGLKALQESSPENRGEVLETILRHEAMRKGIDSIGGGAGVLGRIADIGIGVKDGIELALDYSSNWQKRQQLGTFDKDGSIIKANDYPLYETLERLPGVVWDDLTGYGKDIWTAGKSQVQGGPEWDIYDVYLIGNTKGRVAFDITTSILGPEMLLEKTGAAAAKLGSGVTARTAEDAGSLVGKASKVEPPPLPPVTSEGTANASTSPLLKDQLVNENLANIAAQDSRLAEVIKGSGTSNKNFPIGTGTAAEADALGRIWVGDGARLTSDQVTCPGCLVSADGTRIYRPPTAKPNTPTELAPTGVQANFQQLQNGAVISNGHLNITP